MREFMINIGMDTTIMLKAKNYIETDSGSLRLYDEDNSVIATFAPNTWGHIVDYGRQKELQPDVESDVVELGVVH